MARIFLFHTIDEMLEIITVPFIAETLHDINPITGVTFPMFGELIIAALALTQKVGTYILQITVIYVDLAKCNLVFQVAVSILSGYGVIAGFIQNIGRAFALIAREGVR